MGVNSKIRGFLETNPEDFEDDVLKVPGLTMVEFHRTGCPPCHAFEPMMLRLADLNLHRCRLVRLEVSGMADDPFAVRYELQGEPSCGVFFDGEFLGAYTGAAVEYSFLVSRLNQILYDAAKHPGCAHYFAKPFLAEGPSQIMQAPPPPPSAQ